MEFDSKPINEAKKFKTEAHSINLYHTPPFGQLTLEECEDLFRQRIEALALFERLSDVSGEERHATIASSLREIKSHVYKGNCLLNLKDPKQSKLDQFSHMLARIFCIYQPNQWEWFRSCEKKLMSYRLRHDYLISGSQLESILNSLNFDFERVQTPELVDIRREKLIGWNSRDKDNDEIFKVKFVDAIKFIARRAVSLKDGYAYLTRTEVLSVVCDAFERHLDREFNYGRQHLNLEHPQIEQLLASLELVFIDFQEKINEEEKRLKRNVNGEQMNPFKIDIDDIDDVSKVHFPPCIRYLHESLTNDHHLKHQGRLIYGTFLKSGGVDMDTAIEFWRREFTKKIANDKFERDYKYNIRHLYGKEGHKKSLSCYSCDKIINDNAPGPADKHGCPFKHFDDSHLRTMLVKHGLKEVDVESLFILRNDKDFKGACTQYYKFTKGHLPTETVRNPIHYYYESKRLETHPPGETDVQDDQDHPEAPSGDDQSKNPVQSDYADINEDMMDDF